MKKIRKFLRTYKLLTLSFVAIIIAGDLYIQKHHTAANIILSIGSIIVLLPLLFEMWKEIQTGKYGIDILAATSIIASIILGQYWAAIIVAVMLSGGKSLEDYAENRARSELDSLLNNIPTTATIIKKGKEKVVKAADIKIGDSLIIKVGDIVPVDAVLTDNQSGFDESSLSGEAQPVLKQKGDLLLSGSINLDRPVMAKAKLEASDSHYQQIISLVKGASGTQAPFVRLADKYSVPFTLLAYVIAASVWIISGQAIRFLEVIIVATPCPLLIAAPTALVSGMSRASRSGIVIKSGLALEKLAQAKSFAFDKTGILTEGKLSLSKIKTYNGYTREKALSLIGGLESGSNHLLATSLMNEITTEKIKITKLKQIKELPGLGMEGIYKGRYVIAGNKELMENNDIKMPAKLDTSTQTLVFLAESGSVVAAMYFEDRIRQNSKSTLNKLRKLGVKNIYLVSGDHIRNAKKVAEELDIKPKDVFSDNLPAGKLNVIANIKQRPVVFIGDGVNDAPSLASSEVGIAIGTLKSPAATEPADLVILKDDIYKVSVAYEISKKTLQIARQTIRIGVLLSIILMAVFASGKLKPIYGALLQEVVDIFVIFNALRAHSIKISAEI